MIGVLALSASLFLQAPEVISEIRVHGNVLVSEADVRQISGVKVGAPFTPTTIADAAKKLRDSGKFDTVEVLKRYASLTDPSKIVLVLLVNEGAVSIEAPRRDGDPVRVVKRSVISQVMWMPILDGEDGYGLTFGVRFAYLDVGPKNGRLSFPLTWGGLKQAGVEYEIPFRSGPLSRVVAGADIQRQKNPAFAINDDRRRVWWRAERAFGRVRAGGEGGWQHVGFDVDRDDIWSAGADVTLDTRVDPVFPRNAIVARAAWQRLWFAARPADALAPATPTTDRVRLEARGYIGFIKQTVLVLSATRDEASQTQPRYLEYMLGGWSTLRGFKAGSFTGDIRVTASAELRIPLSNPISVTKWGVSAFVDTGSVYARGVRLSDAPRHTGIGGGIWATAAILHVDFSIAHGLGAGTRANFGIGFSF